MTFGHRHVRQRIRGRMMMFGEKGASKDGRLPCENNRRDVRIFFHHLQKREVEVGINTESQQGKGNSR
jgi:hypothetical protein